MSGKKGSGCGLCARDNGKKFMKWGNNLLIHTKRRQMYLIHIYL